MAWVSSVLLGCYSAQPRAGAPCDQLTQACPAGQACLETGSGSFCLDPSTILDDAAVLTDAADAAAPDVPVDALAQIEVMAAVADCINPAAPDPDVCITQNGTGQLVIDAMDSTTMQPWQAYISFNVPATIAGRTVMSVGLRVVATNDAKAPGTSTGSVFQVAAFTRTSLFTTVPAQMGAALAGSQGTVAINQAITWPLPTSLVTANGTVYLGLTTASADGVNYWNSTGTTPPRLVINLE